MLSNKCKYGIRAVLYISLAGEKQKYIGGQQVASYLNMPPAFTIKILQELAKHQIISSVKGPGGGFYLSKENQQKTLIDVVEVIDGLDFFNRCGLGLSECSETKPCPIHDTFKVCRTMLEELFSKTTLASLNEDLFHQKLRIVT